ncbi:sushi domain-containing protein 2-like [Gigantopelta aegis]|uniref:sushi domain-containing protein 2-like n=1 Tax=Gigantopelta aegis TaxID=1735272 RepID=UPI001B887685|nr:sushi domain-containing protein 2-like [Gigantopelta aegis]
MYKVISGIFQQYVYTVIWGIFQQYVYKVIFGIFQQYMYKVIWIYSRKCSSISPLFGYGTDYGDSIVENLDKLKEVDLKHHVPFFGRKYRTAYISVDGLLGFSSETSYRQIHYSAGPDDPTKDVPFVGPFHYHGDKPSDSRSYQGEIFYRLITDRHTLDDFSVYVLNSTVGHHSFRPAVALQVTWVNVTDALSLEDEGCSAVRGTANQCPSVTFQIVFVASTKHSYIFINYERMAIPLHPYYQAGFNGGDGLGWKSILPCDPPSCSLTLNDLPDLQGSDVIGRYVFDLSGQQIRRGGCIPTELAGDNLLEFYPKFASLLGGQMLNISGTCIPAQASVKCKFGSDPHTTVTEGIVVNSMLARCPVPRLSQRGATEITFSVDGGRTFRHKSTITIVRMGNIPRTVKPQQDGPRRRWNETDADELRITWHASRISYNQHVLLDIKLIGFRETQTEVIWKVIKTLGEGIPNAGTFSFLPSQHRCAGEDCHLFEIGVIEAQLRPEYWTQSNTDVAVSYGIIPLGWFVGDAMKSRYGDNWVVDKCLEWYSEDKKDMSWLDDLLHCPCTLEQALADFGRWQPDVGCSIYNKKPTNCHYHIGAIHCVRSFQPTKRGSGNQCCYGPDKMLKYAADSYQGSTPDRSHDWGAVPYNRPGHVPSASHWLADVITFYYCCLWTNYEHCDYYMDQRPTRDCIGYRPPKAGIAYGDPHLRTFDEQKYNFGGKGDFWLYRSQHIKIQGRFDIRQQTFNFSGFNTTVLTGVAMVEENGQVVEIRLAPPNLMSGNRLQVLVDHTSTYFIYEPLRTQNYKGVSVMTNEGKHHLGRHSNFTVLFKSGVGILVAENSSLLHVTVNLPPQYKNLRTPSGGLLGTWMDKSNYFTAADGSTVSVSAPPGDIYRRFGLTWAVHKEESLFQKAVSVDSQFVPTFSSPSIPPGASFSEHDVHVLCGDNTQCRFDYLVTGDKRTAEATIKSSQWFDALRTFQQPAEVCGLLDVPRSIKDNYNYSRGSTVVVMGCRNGGTVEGEATHTCIKDDGGNLVWSPDVKGHCTASTKALSNGMIAGIVVAVVVLLGIGFAVAVVLYIKRNKDEKSQGEGKRESEHGEADAMMSDLEKRAADTD